MKKWGDKSETDEGKNKTIQGVIKASLEQHAGMDTYKYSDVGSPEHLSSHAYLASESGC